MQNLAHFVILTWLAPPPPFPAQTTRKLTMEVATTSQMLFCDIISEWLLVAKYSIWLCTGFLVAQKWPFSVTRCKHHLIFRTPLRAVCWHTCAPVWTNFGWLYRQGGRLNFNHVLCCCHRGAHQPKLLSLDLNFAPTHGPSTSCSRPFMFVLPPAQLRTCCVLCAIGQCGLLGFPFRTSTFPPTKVACGVRGHPGIREDN
jgi:hypothetical protein